MCALQFKRVRAREPFKHMLANFRPNGIKVEPHFQRALVLRNYLKKILRCYALELLTIGHLLHKPVKVYSRSGLEILDFLEKDLEKNPMLIPYRVNYLKF